MDDTSVIEIIRLCREIDETACDVYAKLSALFDDKELSAFWTEMSSAEAQHVSFWVRAAQIETFSGMPMLFERPDEAISDLKKALARSRELRRGCETSCSISNAFLLAYRMEFYLLHPAFEMLFHLLGPVAGEVNPEDTYDSHIDGFISMFTKQGNLTPEVELLGETLQHLWKENKHLALQATRDDLTSILNRRGFFALALQFAHLAQRAHSTIGVMMVDLDQFKEMNDRHGHQAGDRVLRGIARNIEKTLRTSDIVGRYGGEEFIVMLPEIRNTATADLAEKIRRVIEENPVAGLPMTVSIGCASGALGSQVQQDLDRLIQKADEALYRAKTGGRNKVVE